MNNAATLKPECATTRLGKMKLPIHPTSLQTNAALVRAVLSLAEIIAKKGPCTAVLQNSVMRNGKNSLNGQATFKVTGGQCCITFRPDIGGKPVKITFDKSGVCFPGVTRTDPLTRAAADTGIVFHLKHVDLRSLTIYPPANVAKAKKH